MGEIKISLPKIMAERAIWARKQFIKNPYISLFLRILTE